MIAGGRRMDWARMLAYITGAVDQELLLRYEYLVAENRIRMELAFLTVQQPVRC